VEPMSLMTGQSLRTAMLASALAAAAWNASAQDGDVAAGRAFAREACITCHVVDPANASPRVVVIGPNFQDIANTKGMTATALRVFLTTSHPKMPNLILTPEQIAEVTAYILSLREHQ
jgi:mono/diheme cytochrome c family protein